MIDQIGVLPTLFDKVVLPNVVHSELMRANTPIIVREWIAALPRWVEVRRATTRPADDLVGLDAGEAAAICLASELIAELTLIDERAGVAVARRRGLKVTGTLGILLMAAERGLVDPAETVARLRQTNFHCTEALYSQLLGEDVTGRSR